MERAPLLASVWGVGTGMSRPGGGAALSWTESD